MALPMLAAGLVKGLIGGKSAKKAGGALVKTKEPKIKKAVKEEVRTEKKASFTSVSESSYKMVAKKKAISASAFSPETNEAKVDKKVTNDTLKSQLDNLIESTSTLDGVFKQQYREDKDNARRKDAALAKQRAERREKKLETTPKKKMFGGISLKGPTSIMDMIGKFLLNTLLGGLALLTLNNIDNIGRLFNKFGGNLYLIFNGIRLGLFGLRKFFTSILRLTGSIFKAGLKATGKLIKSSAKLLGRGLKKGFLKLGDAIIDFARGTINLIRRLAGKPPLRPRSGRAGGRNAARPGSRLSRSQRTATASQAARKRYAQRYGPEAARRRFQGNTQRATGQSTRLPRPKNKFLEKLFGRKTAGELKQASPVLKKVSKAAKGVRIPILGPILVAISSMLADEPPKQTMFKAVGTGLGEALGTLIPIPVVGTIIGGLIGEYGGDLLYTFLEGGGISGVQAKMAQDWNNTLKAGADFGQYMKDSWDRYYASLPKRKFGIGSFSKNLPDPFFLFNPMKMFENIDLLRQALFPAANENPPPSPKVEYGLPDEITGQPTGTTAQTQPTTPSTSGAGPTGTVTGGNADFWTLAAVASLEDSDGQSRADIAQSIYNRAASGAYGGGTSNIRKLIIADGQYQPTWDYPRKNPAGSKANPEWLSIVDAQTAGAATGRGAAFVEQAARDIMNPTYQKNARDFVGGRTDFTNYPKPGKRRGEIYRQTGGKNNYFGWDWNYTGTVQGNVPDFGAQATPASVTPVTQPSGMTREQQMQLKLAEQRAATQAAGRLGDPPKSSPAQVATTPNQPIPAISQSASYEEGADLVVPMPTLRTQDRGQQTIARKTRPNMNTGAALIDVVNSYYTAQLMANLYKQG